MYEDNSVFEEEENIQDNDQLKLTKLSKIIIDDKDFLKDGLLEESEDIKLYTNFYPIKFTKPIQICEYPFIIKPECHEESVILKILREASPWLFKKYGYYYRSGNSFFAVRCVVEDHKTKVVIHHKGFLEYTISIKATSRCTTI